ncbi:hypothetical protein GWI33_017173 [Rhynchophorus ferrugineus]|uniref:Uncharacterized protein n=1 Tax=Rhynchophorus ferrugineus TaxID=354439 RepID=A0A834M9G6_RHYFE|nr:hypothetical protein GWI33_017173 [Rhynchophorus ferrugineus]
MFVVYVLFFYGRPANANNLLQECAKYYKPTNYLDLLPNLKLPYVGGLIMPDNPASKHQQKINPTGVVTTKVLTLKTKYVYQNPICIKPTKKKRYCTAAGSKNKNPEKLITKEYFFNPKEKMEESAEQFDLQVTFEGLESSEQESEENEEYRSLVTPKLSSHKIKEILIEDRLSHLETLLPEYKRRKIFETSTIYVTKTISNRRQMATLVVKNCIPVGYEICQSKKQKRRSKDMMDF